MSIQGQAWGAKPIIPATQESEIRRFMMAHAYHPRSWLQLPYPKITKAKRAGGNGTSGRMLA
jgi:hypothetical protein